MNSPMDKMDAAMSELAAIDRTPRTTEAAIEAAERICRDYLADDAETRNHILACARKPLPPEQEAAKLALIEEAVRGLYSDGKDGKSPADWSQALHWAMLFWSGHERLLLKAIDKNTGFVEEGAFLHAAKFGIYDAADERMSRIRDNIVAANEARDHETRRRWTRELNRAISNEQISPYKPEILSQEEMLERCIYVEGRNEVVILPPGSAADSGMKLMSIPQQHFKPMYASSLAAHPVRTLRDGSPVMVPLTDLWLKDPDRRNIRDAMYAIGRGRFITTPDGDHAVNLWTPTKRIEVGETSIKIFLDHIAYLIPGKEDRERFLDWLAHCEQKPHELPHHGWLMWTEQFGIGRNWLASLLLRIWRGEVAPSLDLVALLGGSFNNVLSCKRMAIVDEIHIGSNNSLFTMAARLRQLMTEEIRNINPKYAKMMSEYNSTRWLIFSNHDDALPIPGDDRRFEVVRNPSEAKSEDYYARLYNAVHDPEFVAGVAFFLANRDISKFNPGARPLLTEAKKHVIDASTPQVEKDAQEVLRSWKAAGILMFCSSDLIHQSGANQRQGAVFHHILKRLKTPQVGETRFNFLGAKERFFAVDDAALATLAEEGMFDAAKRRIALERGDGGLMYRAPKEEQGGF